MSEAKLSDLIGRTLTSAENVRGEEISFTTTEGDVYRLHHEQDCCEYVRVEDVAGDLNDLVGAPILMADESSNENETPEGIAAPQTRGPYTWTFYRFGTMKGYVTIRFLGESPGDYSERVSFVKDQ